MKSRLVSDLVGS